MLFHDQRQHDKPGQPRSIICDHAHRLLRRARLVFPAAFTPSWQFTGTNGNAPLRMKHATQNAFIPYTASVAFTGNVGLSQNWRITATVLGQDYQNAFGGTYSDLLTATITP